MPATEIKALRNSGKIEEALKMALAELSQQPENIWAKRNICWVYYEYAKQNCLPEKFDAFSSYLSKIVQLELPEDEKMIFECTAWLIIKMGFALLNLNGIDIKTFDSMLSLTKKIHLTKPSDVYSVLFKQFHRICKDNPLKYLELADWWNFENFRKEDFENEVLPNGKSIMSIVEQAYITYSKHLLPRQLPNGETQFDREKVKEFLPMLDKIEESHPDYQYPPYFKAKLLLALGEKDNILSLLLPFVKRKRNDFWAWDVLSEAFPEDDEKIFACYCKGLSCFAPKEMVVRLRAKIVPCFLEKEMWDEAKTEIVKIVESYRKKSWNNIPGQVLDWTSQPWFSSANEKKDNKNTYREFAHIAEEILFYDNPEETVIVEFVNSDKKILNFIASDNKFGFCKYDLFLQNIRIGETLKVRLTKKETNGLCQIATMKKCDDPDFKKIYMKKFQGVARIKEDKNFGFVDDVFLTPGICAKNKFVNGSQVTGNAIKTFDEKKNQWGWKAYEIKNNR
jgi:hypothetical protein